jgi:hypothetical protein
LRISCCSAESEFSGRFKLIVSPGYAASAILYRFPSNPMALPLSV